MATGQASNVQATCETISRLSNASFFYAHYDASHSWYASHSRGTSRACLQVLTTAHVSPQVRSAAMVQAMLPLPRELSGKGAPSAKLLSPKLLSPKLLIATDCMLSGQVAFHRECAVRTWQGVGARVLPYLGDR